jgi:signal transduction histidine kinase
VEIHHPDDRARTIDTLAHSLKTGEPYSIEYRLTRHDGQYRWHLGRAFPLRDVNGKIKAWFGTNTDIHDQKLHEAMLEETLRARDEFLSLAIHELKTPITCLKLQFQMARRLRNQVGALVYDQDRINRLIDKSDDQVNRLVKLIEDMFDITRIRSGKFALSREMADLSELVIEVYERLSSHLKHIQVHLNFDKTLSYQANFDRSRMDQVITNLFTNAVKYGDGKPVEVAVRDCEEDNDFLLLSVKDQGRGIKPESLERIFDRFERDVNPNEVAGLGLGLYISRKIIEAHGGKIWCESEGLGKGSTFKVKVPKNHS